MSHDSDYDYKRSYYFKDLTLVAVPTFTVLGSVTVYKLFHRGLCLMETANPSHIEDWMRANLVKEDLKNLRLPKYLSEAVARALSDHRST